jgi:hypothetical protein
LQLNLYRPIILLFFIFFICPSFSEANDAPLRIVSGGATPTVRGGIDRNVNVQMNSETVLIILNQHSYIVDATFNFMNTGTSKVIPVGFPKRARGFLGNEFEEVSPFINFETWVNETKVVFNEIPGMSSIKSSRFPRINLPELLSSVSSNSSHHLVIAKDYRWMVKDVTFTKGKTVTTRVRYEVPYFLRGNAYYIFGTGRHWGGKIKEANFVIDASKILGSKIDYIFVGFNNGPAKKKIKVKEQKNILKIQILDFEPHKDGELEINADGAYIPNHPSLQSKIKGSFLW